MTLFVGDTELYNCLYLLFHFMKKLLLGAITLVTFMAIMPISQVSAAKQDYFITQADVVKVSNHRYGGMFIEYQAKGINDVNMTAKIKVKFFYDSSLKNPIEKGKVKVITIPQFTSGPEKDKDNDGIKNSHDNCPAITGSEFNLGCPLKTVGSTCINPR